MKHTFVVIIFSLALVMSSFSTVELNQNLSFERTEYGLPASWWDYNNSPATGTVVSTSTEWASDGTRSVKLEIKPNAQPNWCGIGQRLRIKPSNNPNLKKLYVSANVNAIVLKNTHIKLEAKLLKVINKDGEHEYYMIEEAMLTYAGPQTILVVLEMPKTLNRKGIYQIDINFVLGSNFQTISENSYGTVYVDEVSTKFIE